MEFEEAKQIFRVIFATFAPDRQPSRDSLLKELQARLPDVAWEEALIHVEAEVIRSQPGPALPEWLR